MGVLSSYADMQDGTWQQGYDYRSTMTANGTVAKDANAYIAQVEQDYVSSDIRDDVLEATQEASQLMARRLRQAQLAALRGAEAQIAAKKRFDAETPIREKDPRLDVREPPSPTATSTASHGALSAGMSTESRAAFEGSQCSEGESVHSQRSSASRSMTNNEATQMKVKIYEAMEKLAQAREAASVRRNHNLQVRENLTMPLPSSEPQGGDTEPPVQSPVRVVQPPKEGAAWEAARLEVARALAGGSPRAPEVSESRLPIVSGARDPATLRPRQASSLGLKHHKVREKERFAAAVQLQMRAQEAMKKRVEMSDIFRKQDPNADSS